MERELIIGEASPDRRLPDYVRQAGYFLDVGCLQIGDIFLSSPLRPNRSSRAIISNQASGYDENFSQWTHVGIYVGEGLTCEATLKGVVVKDIYDHLDKNTLLFRRYKKWNNHERYLCAIKALQKLGKPYNYSEIISHYFDGMRKIWRSRTTNGFSQSYDGAFTCSGMVYEVFLEATRISIFDRPQRPCPADFAASNMFEDVVPEWRYLPGRAPVLS